ELRLVLEPWCAALAAERATPEDLAHMRRLLQGTPAPSDPRHNFRVDLSFHRALARAARNARLAAILGGLQAHSFRFFRYLRAERQSPKAIRAEHGRIVEAVAEGDQGKAAALMRAHVEHARRALLAALAGSPSV